MSLDYGEETSETWSLRSDYAQVTNLETKIQIFAIKWDR
jgi:hypothetical protein